MKVVILAGGFGTRISEESHFRPKPMIEIGGQPILWHIMKIYSYFGFHEFIICCGYKGYMIKEYFADYYLHRSDVTFNFTESNRMTVHNNEAEPWKVTLVDTGLSTQTGGRLKRIRAYTENESFMMTYGDGVSDIDLPLLLDTHRKSGKTVTISAVELSSRFGVLSINNKNGAVTGFREKSKTDGEWINAGFMVMEPSIFDYIDGDDAVLEKKTFETLSRDGGLGVYKHHGFWQCMDTQRDRDYLEKLWQSGDTPWML